MLKTLHEAKEYALDRVSQVSGEELLSTEKMIIQTSLEEMFRNKLSEVISDDEIDSLNAQDDDDLEGKLFYKIPNYVDILEETTAQFLAEYLSPEVDDNSEDLGESA